MGTSSTTCPDCARLNVGWIDLGLTLAGLPVCAAGLYLAGLAAFSRRLANPIHGRPHLRFDIVVPAHNEESGIGQTVASLLAVDYPRGLFRLFVVADNCADRTAQRAAEAGAQVLVRSDPDHRGKGYTLAYAFTRSLSDGFADAIVVVDADSLVSDNLLLAFASRLEKGASVLQADYGVRNPSSSWRTRMMTIALAAFHRVQVGRTRTARRVVRPARQRHGIYDGGSSRPAAASVFNR